MTTRVAAFSSVLSQAIKELDGAGVNYEGALLKDLLRTGSKTPPGWYVSRWRNSEPEGLFGPFGPNRLARICSKVAETNPRLTRKLLASYICELLEKDALDGKASEVYKAASMDFWFGSKNSPKISRENWIQLAIYLHLKVRLGEVESAFDMGWRAWKLGRHGYDVPTSASYSIRSAIFMAKSNLLITGRLDPLVEKMRSSVPFTTRPPAFAEFQARSGVRREFAPQSSEFRALELSSIIDRTLYRSIKVDHLLRSGAADSRELAVLSVRYTIPTQFEEFGWLSLHAAMSNRDTDLFNGIKIRFCKAFTSEEWASALDVEQTTYLATQVTNFSSDRSFSELQTGRIIELADSSGGLPKALDLSSHIGAMALLLTKDGHLVCVFQASTNNRGGNRIVPLGGSVEFFDIELLRPVLSLGALLKHSISREIAEEADIHDSEIKRVILLGHTQDGSTGLKPDFYGIAFIDCLWAEIRMNREELFGGPLDGFKLDMSTPGSFLDSVTEADTKWRPQQAHAFLHANLLFLREAADLVYSQFQQVFPEHNK